jgi:hypothetical protein
MITDMQSRAALRERGISEIERPPRQKAGSPRDIDLANPRRQEIRFCDELDTYIHDPR